MAHDANERATADHAHTTTLPPAHPPRQLVYDPNYSLAISKLVRVHAHDDCEQYVATELLGEAHPGPDTLPGDWMPDYKNGIPPSLATTALQWQDTVTDTIATHPTVEDLIDFDSATDASDDSDINLHAATTTFHDIIHKAIDHLTTPSHTDPAMWVLVELPVTGVLGGWHLVGAADLVLVIADPTPDPTPPHSLTIIVLDAKATHNESTTHVLQPAVYAALIDNWLAGPDTPLKVHATPSDITWDLETGIISYDTDLPDTPDPSALPTTTNWRSLVADVRSLLGDNGLVTTVWTKLPHTPDTPPTASTPDTDTETDTETADETAAPNDTKTTAITRTMGDHCTGCSLKEACYLDAYHEDGLSLDLLHMDDATQAAYNDHDIDSIADLAALARGYTSTGDDT